MTKALERREALLDIARRRMLHDGIQKTSMHDIARDAGIAVGTLYLYFKNKEDMVLALADEYRARQNDIAEEILHSGQSADEKIRCYMRNRFRFVTAFREDTPHGKEFVRVLLQIRPEAMQEWRERVLAYLVRCLNEGKEQEIFHIEDPECEARMLFMATQAFYPLPYLDFPVWPQEQDLDVLLGWFIQQWKK